MTILSQCKQDVEGVFATYRGRPEEIRPRYRQLTDGMLFQYAAMSPPEREHERGGVTPDGSALLLGVARSAANSAVEEKDAERLRVGLLALLLEDGFDDCRRLLIELSLLDNSARHLGVDLELLWSECAPFGSSKTAELIGSYFLHGDRQIAAMGYIESKDRNGRFAYKQNW